MDEREILREIAEQKRREHVQLVATLGDVALAIHCDGGRRINHADIEHRFSTFVDARVGAASILTHPGRLKSHPSDGV